MSPFSHYVACSLAVDRIDLIHLAVYNLTRNVDEDKVYVRWREDICRFIDEHWDVLTPGKTRMSFD